MSWTWVSLEAALAAHKEQRCEYKNRDEGSERTGREHRDRLQGHRGALEGPLEKHRNLRRLRRHTLPGAERVVGRRDGNRVRGAEELTSLGGDRCRVGGGEC